MRIPKPTTAARQIYRWAAVLLIVVSTYTAVSAADLKIPRKPSAYGGSYGFCDRYPYLCTDPVHYSGQEYVGHDEPSLLFYSATPGSGNSFKAIITLPKDPVTKPNQAGTGGTWNFQLHPAFWFGMALCDTQSYPEFTNTCVADSDTNIFNNADPLALDFIGNHPGSAYMEMQFYPPGWVIAPNNLECSKTKWCAALNIDSYLFNPNTDTLNNAACQNTVGDEPINFSFITKSGIPPAPPDPITGFANQLVVNSDTFLMNTGDTIEVRIFDNGSPSDPVSGLEVVLRDLTNGKTGSMIASQQNGFAQVVYDPLSSNCMENPYSFHPMYSTSTASTRVPWAAHSYNVAFADEVGHFEYCAVADPFSGFCLSSNDSLDDAFCYNSSDSSNVKIGGCTYEDRDFNGPTYLFDWPGTASDPVQDKKMHAQPVKFSGTFVGTNDGVAQQFDSAAFETDLPAIESGFGTGCDITTGNGCTNPPILNAFYPFYSTGTDANGGCVWQLGGVNIANSNYTFDSNTYSNSSEYGNVLGLIYPDVGEAITIYNDFQNALSSNPCNAALPVLNASLNDLEFKTTKVGKSSAAKSVKLTNSLANKLGFGINGITAQLDDPTDFTITKNTCTGTEVLPKKHCTITVKATPASTTTIIGHLTINSESSSGPVTVTLGVTGT